MTVPLLPTRITVAPDPSLIIHYLWEKFVIGDNPFTAEREPSVPFALGVAVHNAGYGTAMNMRITSGQPEIIENEKGLLVTFKIIGTQVGSERVTPSLSVKFGDIGPTETRVARWLLLSSHKESSPSSVISPGGAIGSNSCSSVRHNQLSKDSECTPPPQLHPGGQ